MAKDYHKYPEKKNKCGITKEINSRCHAVDRKFEYDSAFVLQFAVGISERL